MLSISDIKRRVFPIPPWTQKILSSTTAANGNKSNILFTLWKKDPAESRFYCFSFEKH